MGQVRIFHRNYLRVRPEMMAQDGEAADVGTDSPQNPSTALLTQDYSLNGMLDASTNRPWLGITIAECFDWRPN